MSMFTCRTISVTAEGRGAASGQIFFEEREGQWKTRENLIPDILQMDSSEGFGEVCDGERGCGTWHWDMMDLGQLPP